MNYTVDYTTNNEGDIILENGKVISLKKNVETYLNNTENGVEYWNRKGEDKDGNEYTVVWTFYTEETEGLEDLSNLDWDGNIYSILDESGNDLI